uniref:Glycosyltransferase RgtA/B/C/D-like domain-containing protein n=1 Tax=Phaselicystis flava TaxID=525924 RepID=A0A3S7V089_9BACT|nr:hypothetical protein [Phaselicystis flava]
MIDSGALAAAQDGCLFIAAALVYLAVVLRRQLATTPTSERAALAGVVALGAALRLGLSPIAPMEAWPYGRTSDLGRWVEGSRSLAELGWRFYITDVFFATNTLIAILTPLAVYAHARYLAQDRRVALFAAALLALLPNHLRFSRSEVSFIPLVAMSSLCFTLAHAAIVEPSRALRRASLAALPILAIVTFGSRPLAVVLAPMIAAAAWYLEAEAPRRRRLAVIGLVGAAAAWDFVFHLLGRWGAQVQAGLRLDTLIDALLCLFTYYNTLLHPVVTPVGFVALAIVGAVALQQRGDRPRLFLLVGWLLAYYLTLGFAIAPVTAMQARYHLHLVEPFVLLAAFGLAALWELRRRVGVAAAAYAAAVPLLHAGYIRDVDFTQMREFAFLERVRAALPEGCTVLEFVGPTGAGIERDATSRVGRMGTWRAGGRTGHRWRVVLTGDDEAGASAVRPEALATIAEPPACLALYEGMACWTEKPLEASLAPACAELRKKLRLTPIVAEEAPLRVYNDAWQRGIVDPYDWVDKNGRIQKPTVDRVTFTLYRVEGLRAAGPAR